MENFFKWNQLTIHQSDGMWAEYVHLEAWILQVVAGGKNQATDHGQNSLHRRFLIFINCFKDIIDRSILSIDSS